MSQEPTFGEVDLTNCDREPIHIPGSVQPHGLLLVLHPDNLTILQVGGDAGLLETDAESLLGRPAADHLGAENWAKIAAFLNQSTLLSQPRRSFDTVIEVGRAPIDVSIFSSDGLPVLEFEPRRDAEKRDPLFIVQTMLTHLHELGTVDGFLQGLVNEVRDVTGLDRVMLYRFLDDGSGAVVAEAKAQRVDSYKGLHYPASDIPKQARDLYVRNWIRLIPNARYVPAPLRPVLNPVTGKPLDMSLSALRSVSPIHLEYLSNMGVTASMSLSLVVGGRLWGLVLGHHYEPAYLSKPLRSACELFAQMTSVQLSEKIANAEQAERIKLQEVHVKLVENLSKVDKLDEALTRFKPDLLDYIPGAGVAVYQNGHVSTLGLTPANGFLHDLVDWTIGRSNDGVLVTDRLSSLYEPGAAFAREASGIIILIVSRERREAILWFRPEFVETVMWAGDPDKPVESDERVSPRKSFAAWRMEVHHRSRPWESYYVDAAAQLRVSLLEVVLRRLDQVAREREKSRAQQDFLMAELDHRVKNSLATIQSLARHSSDSAESVEGFMQSFQKRLHSMARTHNLLTQSRWQGADLHAVVTEQTDPYAGADMKRVTLIGDRIRLRPKAALSVSLAVHELSTNAAKYGALSVPSGRLTVQWRMQSSDDSRWLTIVWTERGGPPVKAPTRRGFGRTLLERTLAFEVDGRVDLDFAPEGLSCTALIPAEQVIEPEGVAAPVAERSVPRSAPIALSGKRVLLVEDQGLVAMEAEAILEDAKAVVVGPAGRLARAAALAESETLDVALLDVDLNGEPVWSVADLLQKRRVPFAFATGYQATLVVPDRFRNAPVLVKPYREDDMLRMLQQLLN